MIFEEFLDYQIKGQGKFYYSYLGIKKKDFPKWNGWSYIDKIKKQNIPIGEISDPYLDQLVYNFYLIQFIDNYLFGNELDSEW